MRQANEWASWTDYAAANRQQLDRDGLALQMLAAFRHRDVRRVDAILAHPDARIHAVYGLLSYLELALMSECFNFGGDPDEWIDTRIVNMRIADALDSLPPDIVKEWP